MKKTVIIVVILSFIVSLGFYQKMPSMMATHWDAAGNVNGYMTKLWGLFLLPVIIAAMVVLFFLVPHIDPLKVNIKKFEKEYYGFIFAFTLFMLFIHMHVLLWNMGIKLSTNVVIPIGMGVLFFYLGSFLKKVRRNWFIGIRTPWTLSSDRVWDKTHSMGSILFKIAGILALIGVLFQKHVFYFIMVPVISASLITVLYSYLEWKKGK